MRVEIRRFQLKATIQGDPIAVRLVFKLECTTTVLSRLQSGLGINITHSHILSFRLTRTPTTHHPADFGVGNIIKLPPQTTLSEFRIEVPNNLMTMALESNPTKTAFYTRV